MGAKKQNTDGGHTQAELAVFVGIKEAMVSKFEALDSPLVYAGLNDVRESYPLLALADAITVALRKLDVASTAIRINAHTAGPGEGPNPRDYPGYALSCCTSLVAKRFGWTDPEGLVISWLAWGRKRRNLFPA